MGEKERKFFAVQFERKSFERKREERRVGRQERCEQESQRQVECRRLRRAAQSPRPTTTNVSTTTNSYVTPMVVTSLRGSSPLASPPPPPPPCPPPCPSRSRPRDEQELVAGDRYRHLKGTAK